MGNSCCDLKPTQKVPTASRYRTLSPEWDVTAEPADGYFAFTVGEAFILKEKWPMVIAGPNEMKFGACIFTKLFEAHPEATKLFFAHQKDGFVEFRQWLEHPLFRSHMHRVLDGVGTAILLCDDPYPREEYCQTLEAYHHKLARLEAIYVETFVRVIDDTLQEWLNDAYDGECKRAFRKVLHMLYYYITLNSDSGSSDRDHYYRRE